MKWIFSFIAPAVVCAVFVILVGCMRINIQDNLIGDTKIERKYDENGALIYYKKTNCKLTDLRIHTHNSYIYRTTTKTIKDHKTIELYFQKTRPNYCTLEYDVLKTKRIVWDENRKKTVTRTRKK